MSLTNTVVKQSYAGNGATLVFAIPHDIIRTGSDEVEVILRDETDPDNITETPQTNGVHYNLTGGTPPTDVTMVTAPSATQVLIVRRKFTISQIISYLASGAFPASSHEEGLDRIVAMIQLAFEYLSRVPILSKGTQNPQPQMPEPIAETVWGWDSDAETVKNWTPLELFESLVGLVLLKANNLSDLTSVNTALDNLGIDPFKITASQSVNNNEGTNQNITNLAFAGASYTSAVIYYQIRRVTDTDSKIAVGRLFVYRKPHTGNWFLETGEWYGDDVLNPGGLTFNLQQTGNDAQIRYTSDNLTGANYVGTIKTSVKYFKV